MKFRIDTFTLLLLGAIVLATFLPATGRAGDMLATTGTVAVALLFFFHGAALSREQIVSGATHWRLHILITSLTFIFFPLAVLPINGLSDVVPSIFVLLFRNSSPFRHTFSPVDISPL